MHWYIEVTDIIEQVEYPSSLLRVLDCIGLWQSPSPNFFGLDKPGLSSIQTLSLV